MAMDAVTLITTDHRNVEALFEQALAPGGSEERARVVGQIIRELSMHAVVEEMLLYPAARRSVPDGERLADESLDEHQDVKEMLAQLDGMDADDDRVTTLITDLQDAVTSHAQEEETELLPALESALGVAAMESLGKRMERAKAAAPTRPHPHAPNTPPGNVIVGIPTGMVDRMRDALDATR